MRLGLLMLPTIRTRHIRSCSKSDHLQNAVQRSAQTNNDKSDTPLGLFPTKTKNNLTIHSFSFTNANGGLSPLTRISVSTIPDATTKSSSLGKP